MRETLEQIADRIVPSDGTITHRRADELHSGLQIRTLRGWRGITEVNRLRRRVMVVLDTGQHLVFPAGQTFQTREAS